MLNAVWFHGQWRSLNNRHLMLLKIARFCTRLLPCKRVQNHGTRERWPQDLGDRRTRTLRALKGNDEGAARAWEKLQKAIHGDQALFAAALESVQSEPLQ